VDKLEKNGNVCLLGIRLGRNNRTQIAYWKENSFSELD
jgi:hypothetical protein